LSIKLHPIKNDACCFHHIVAHAVAGHPRNSVFSHRTRTVAVSLATARRNATPERVGIYARDAIKLSRCAALRLPSSSGRPIHLFVETRSDQFFGATGDDQLLRGWTEWGEGK